jgi:hypothetical protein
MSFLETLFDGRNSRIEAVITDVTRMHQDKVCVAAIHRRGSIRLHNPHPREQWLRSIDGLAPGDVVSLTWRPVRRYRPPHSEDGDWNPARFEKIRHLSDEELVERLRGRAFSGIEKAFGKPRFQSENGNAAFAPDQGSRSLASLLVNSIRLYPVGEGVRADFTDDRHQWKMVPVEDLAIRSGRHPYTLEATQALLRVGLGRPFQAGERPPACYLQVNHVFPLPSNGGITTQGARV